MSIPLRVPTLLACTITLCACASSLEEAYVPAEFAGSASAFEADSTLQADERAIYLAALAYASPESSSYDPNRAIHLLERLLTLHPRSRYANHARYIHQLLGEVDRLDTLATEATEERDSLAAELAGEREQVEALQEDLWELTVRADAHEAIAMSLRREILQRDARIRQLEDELSALKKIDLNRPLTR
ncbi:MAG: hypothetical protein GEU90_09665 [Gemmatimonas sp.]|nr:hypothetical protein [Gemmatimonas sp.]